MEIHRKKFAWLLLTVFVSNFLLGCAQDNSKPSNSVEETVSNIQERLKNKDYRAHDRAVNPMAEYKQAMSYAIRQGKKTLVSQRGASSVVFRKVNAVPVPDELATWGIDNPQNFEMILQESISYFAGTHSPSEVTTALTSLNDYMLNFPRNESGVQQLLADGVASGSMTNAQRSIIEAQLQALVNVTSASEAMNIVNLVNQELANSQMNSNEANELYTINAGVEGALDSGAIAVLGSNGNAIQTGAQAVGVGVFLVGIAVLTVGAFNDNSETAAYGFMLAMTGLMIAII